ncbi:cytosine permease [Thermocatellispora tengchongensis]|uniref:cytosine permease n=1 Tax=Thermocatellispora tengchongensis TaxID=1073253 RepID=UPI00362C343D
MIAAADLPPPARAPLEAGLALAGAAVVWYGLRRGPDSLRDMTTYIAAGVIVLGAVVLVLLIRHVGWDAITAARPSSARPDHAFNYATGVELLVASNLSWWAYTGAIIRLAPSTRATLWPAVVGLGLSVGLVSLIGLYTGLAVPGSGGDPSRHLLELGGVGVGMTALAFIVLANIGTAIVGVYVATLALRQIPRVARIPWNVSTLAPILPVAVVSAFLAAPFSARFGTFLTLCGVLFGPIAGIQIVDYHLLRRARLDVAAAFDPSRRSAYHFWGGVNPVGFAALAAGVAVYVYLLNPLTYVSHPPYEHITAGIPSAVAAGAVYALGTRLVLRPLGKGGYGP